MAEMEPLQKSLADKGEAIHGKISTAKVNPKGLAQITYKDGTVSLINKNGAIQCKLVTDVVVSQLPNGKKYLKRADGKMDELDTTSYDTLIQQAVEKSKSRAVKPPSASPKKAASPKKESPKKIIKRKIIAAAESSSSDSSSDSDSSSSASSKKVKKAAKKPSKATRKPAAKRATSPRTKRRRSPSSSSESEKVAEVPYDSDLVTLSRIALKLGDELDLSDAAEAERLRMIEEEKLSRKPPSKPTKNRFPSNMEALEKKLETLEQRVNTQEANMSIKDGTKEVSLGTSKTNYIDPRVIIAWAKREDVRLSQIYSKSLVSKFIWAKGVDPDWRFTPSSKSKK